MMHLYKLVTRLDENNNWAHYYVASESGMQAAAWLTANVLNRTTKGNPKKKTGTSWEVVDEIELVAPIEYEA